MTHKEVENLICNHICDGCKCKSINKLNNCKMLEKYMDCYKIGYENALNNKITTEIIKTTSISAHDAYSCVRPENIETMDCCKTCTSRQPNINCKFLRIETIYIKD